MRFMRFRDSAGREGVAVASRDGSFRGLLEGADGFPGSLETLLAQGPDALEGAAAKLSAGAPIDADKVQYLPPLTRPGKIVCIGLNYVDHSKESGFEAPAYPAVFGRFTSSLVGHGQALVRPKCSEQLDFEGELVAVIGRGGRNISKRNALEHVAGYSIFNDGSVRDYQFKGAQWAVGKNFDGTGAFGPCFVTADELPQGAKGLRLQTRLNGAVVQSASTSDMIFDVATLIEILSEAMTLEAGDVIVTGTPAGVGHARSPRLYMKAGDFCEVEIEGLGVLRNPVVDA